MHAFISQHFTHFIALVVLISRLGDLATTYLVSPTLQLEANLIARRLGWKFAAATLLIALVPYYSTTAGVIIATASLLVSASNATKIMTARALGEQEYAYLARTVVARTRPALGLLFGLLPAGCYALLGGLILLFYPDPVRDWGFYLGVGVLTYAFVIAFWGSIRFLQLKQHERHRPSRPPGQPAPAIHIMVPPGAEPVTVPGAAGTFTRSAPGTERPALSKMQSAGPAPADGADRG